MKKNKEQKPDFYTPANNCVVAVYCVNPEILELDNPAMRGKPFIFYEGQTRSRGRTPENIEMQTTIGRLIYGVDCLVSDGRERYPKIYSKNPDQVIKVKPFVGGRDELEDLLKNRKEGGKLPDVVTINGQEVKSKRLGNGYVPFCWGVGQLQDFVTQVETGTNFRTDLNEFKTVLKKYDTKKARESKLSYKVKSFFGLGVQ